jgi:hypothetical protein
MSLIKQIKILREQIIELYGFNFFNFEIEIESSDYNACSFEMNEKFVRYRQAKITPTKIGQFVTLWKRKGKKPIQPFDSSDLVDLIVVTVKAKNRFGQFVFPKSVLVKQGVFSINGKGGRRALRVYPPWDKAQSKQAAKTQKWQLEFFTEISNKKSLNVQNLNALYSTS